MAPATKPRPEYVLTASEAMEVVEVSRPTWAKWTKDPDFPRRTGKGWNVQHLLEFQRLRLARSCGAEESEDPAKMSLKEQKTRKEIALLEVRIAKLKGDVIELEDHKAELLTHAGMVKRTFGNLARNLRAKGLEAKWEAVVAAEVSRCFDALDKLVSE